MTPGPRMQEKAVTEYTSSLCAPVHTQNHPSPMGTNYTCLTELKQAQEVLPIRTKLGRREPVHQNHHADEKWQNNAVQNINEQK